MNFNPFRWSFRAQFFTGVIVIAALMAYAFLEQYQMGVEPCPLCSFQRLAFVGMGLFFLIGAMHNPARSGRWVYAVLVTLCGIGGVGVSARHLYLQSLPASEVPACGPGLNYMLDAFPFSKVLDLVFTGSGECAEVNWRFLGLSMPAWTLLFFVALSFGAIWAASRKRVSLGLAR